jgi:hypothetical protein
MIQGLQSNLVWSEQLPYGLGDLEEGFSSRYKSKDTAVLKDGKIRCCIAGCTEFVIPRKTKSGLLPHNFCPIHRVSSGSTYVYEHHEQNLIIGRDWFKKVMAEKWESRVQNENSEDALTWNVFVGLYALNGLKYLVKLFTGQDFDEEPELYLWGCRIAPNKFKTWDNLANLRNLLEPKNEVLTPTEPDIILRIEGKIIVLIEAKFGSRNGVLFKKEKAITTESFLIRYAAKSKDSDPLNREWIQAQEQKQILAQLCRNALFSTRLGGPGEKPFVVNLVRQKDEINIEERFSKHLLPGIVDFRRVEWESIYHLDIIRASDDLPLKNYFRNKTKSLRKAFQLSAI